MNWKMNNNLSTYLRVLFCFFLIGETMGQIVLAPLEEEASLVLKSEQEKTKTRGLSGQYFRIFTLGEGEEINLCIDTLQIAGAFSELTDLHCRALSFGSLSIEENCFSYFSGSVEGFGYDTLCLQLLDDMNNVYPRYYVFKVMQPLRLPLMEDFTKEGPWPDPAMWVEKDVFVNQRLGLNAPGIGVATFDGLTAEGRARGGGFGTSDTLTSNFIDLSTYGATSNVYLSFFLQPKGLGIQPSIRDSIVLQFKNAQGQWQSVFNRPGLSGIIPGNESPPFEFSAQRIRLQYLHDQFQFRFINYSNRRGLEGLWHLDYVRVTDSGIPNGSFEDVAFTRNPSFLFEKFTCVPIRQFRAQPQSFFTETFDIGVYNHFSERVTISPSSLKIFERNTNQVLEEKPTLLEVPPVVAFNQRDLEPGFYNFTNLFPINETLNRVNEIIDLSDAFVFETTYELAQSIENGINFKPTLANNKTQILTEVKDCYAYDDGTAERVIIANNSSGPQIRVALRFPLIVADTLRGIQIHFPRYGVPNNARFNLYLWEDLDQDPIAALTFQNPFFGDVFFGERNAFSTYVFRDSPEGAPQPIALSPGVFYIGWEQIGRSGEVAIGYDTNTNSLEDIFYNVGLGWESFADAPTASPGSVMMRPVFGSMELFPTAIKNTVKDNMNIKVFPNPTQGYVFLSIPSTLDSSQLSMELMGPMGQILRKGPAEDSLDLSNFPKGMYYLRIYSKVTHQSQTLKIINN
jgi:hypothetical protein